jgi:hypothetical protein
VDVDHPGDRRRAEVGSAVTAVPRSPIRRVPDAGFAELAVAHEESSGADGAEVVQGLDRRDTHAVGQGVDGRRDEGEEIVDVHDRRALPPDGSLDDAEAELGASRSRGRLQLRPEAPDQVVREDAGADVHAPETERLDLALDRDVLAAVKLVTVVQDENAHAGPNPVDADRTASSAPRLLSRSWTGAARSKRVAVGSGG